MDKKLKVSSKLQINKLIDLMEDNIEMGRGKQSFGCSRAQAAAKWNQFAEELNSLGPPSRTGDEWKRVWINYKGNLKRKMANNRKNFEATGGGLFTEVSLTAKEQCVEDLMHLERQVEPPGTAFGLINSITATLQAINTNVQARIEDKVPEISRQPLKKRKKLEEERLQYLKYQGRTQKATLKTLKSIDSTLQKLYNLKAKKAESAIKAKEAKLELTTLKIKKLQGEDK